MTITTSKSLKSSKQFQIKIAFINNILNNFIEDALELNGHAYELLVQASNLIYQAENEAGKGRKQDE